MQNFVGRLSKREEAENEVTFILNFHMFAGGVLFFSWFSWPTPPLNWIIVKKKCFVNSEYFVQFHININVN